MTTPLNGSVVKAFDILNLFHASRAEITAGYVQETLGMNFITAHRFLRTLESVGALVAVEKGRYRLGYALVDLSQKAVEETNLAAILQPLLVEVTQDMQEASMATGFDGQMVVCIAKAASPHPLFVDIRVGSKLEAYCTAHGKLWLAFMDEAKLNLYLDTVVMRQATPASIVDRDKLLQELREVRANKVAFNHEERDAGIVAVAVPVLARTGNLICGLSVFGPPHRLTGAALETAADRLRSAAQAVISGLYGSSSPELRATEAD